MDASCMVGCCIENKSIDNELRGLELGVEKLSYGLALLDHKPNQPTNQNNKPARKQSTEQTSWTPLELKSIVWLNHEVNESWLNHAGLEIASKYKAGTLNGAAWNSSSKR